MSDYTTVRIKKSSLEKINKIKGNGSVADVVEDLLRIVNGAKIEDIIEIKRDDVAILLEYHIIDDKGNFRIKDEYPITFQELKLSKVGDTISATTNPTADRYSIDTAEILYIDERSVLVRVTETHKNRNRERSDVHIEHIDLF